jgi:ABC-type transporter Mla MlaB component
VKIFSLFGKTAIRHVRNTSTPPLQPDLQALDTSKKIDAIEYEMSAEFSSTLPPQSEASSSSGQASDLRQMIEEAAILFGSSQTTAARELLTAATAQTKGNPDEKLAWRMLLELHEFESDQVAFEQRALAYAQCFETSPPPWQCADTRSASIAANKLPSLSFRGKLSASSGPILKQLFQMGCQHRRFRLEFVNVSEVDLAGCSTLLHTLTAWQAQSCDVSLHNAHGLTEKIRGLIQSGRRDDDDSGWHLLMELLWIMQATTEYEMTCLDYSITYEVSPPSPRSIQTTFHDTKPGSSDQPFIMPATIETPIDNLLANIDLYAQSHDRMVLDCSGLRRVDFNAATPLLAGLNRLASIKTVELRHTSFLVSVLLQLVGGNGKLNIIHRKT